jgi:hypothetical protein
VKSNTGSLQGLDSYTKNSVTLQPPAKRLSACNLIPTITFRWNQASQIASIHQSKLLSKRTRTWTFVMRSEISCVILRHSVFDPSPSDRPSICFLEALPTSPTPISTLNSSGSSPDSPHHHFSPIHTSPAPARCKVLQIATVTINLHVTQDLQAPRGLISIDFHTGRPLV